MIKMRLGLNCYHSRRPRMTQILFKGTRSMLNRRESIKSSTTKIVPYANHCLWGRIKSISFVIMRRGNRTTANEDRKALKTKHEQWKWVGNKSQWSSWITMGREHINLMKLSSLVYSLKTSNYFITLRINPKTSFHIVEGNFRFIVLLMTLKIFRSIYRQSLTTIANARMADGKTMFPPPTVEVSVVDGWVDDAVNVVVVVGVVGATVVSSSFWKKLTTWSR